MRYLLLSLFLINLYPWNSIIAGENKALDDLIQASKARAEVVNSVQKAVVQIKVEKAVHSLDNRHGSNDSYDVKCRFWW